VKPLYVILPLLCSSLLCSANNEGFDRYQVIIDKRPFGEEPPEAGAETKEIKLTESFAKNLRLSMLFQGAKGVRVGFIDSSKNDKSYILSVGESIDGIELVEANIDASEALLQKGNEIALFTLKAAPEMITQKERSSRRSTYADRRKAQLAKAAEKRAEQAQAPQLTGEELRQHLEEVQMDAIRTGKPPLPMALTPEMDAQLVAEGVLDPQ
jgi:hypothetical protein